MKELDMLYKMILIREFENTISKYKFNGKIYGSVHCCNGQEAVAVGVCSALKKRDYVVTNHRPHGHIIAKGAPIKSLMAEIFGKSTGCNGGKGGSMHLNSAEFGVTMASAIVGSGIPVACGNAFSSKYKKDKKVTVVFFGDGSANEGVLHECLNLASIWNLPIVFVLEDNDLAITVQTKNTSSCKSYVELAKYYGIKGSVVDGQDIEKIYNESLIATEMVREQSCPFFIYAKTYRFQEHAEGQFYLRMRQTNYRDNSEIDRIIMSKCPIKLFVAKLFKNGKITKFQFQNLCSKAIDEIQSGLDYAFASVEPSIHCAFENVFAENE